MTVRIILYSPTEYTVSVLPRKCSGRCWIEGKDGTGKRINLIHVDARTAEEGDGAPQWFFVSNKRYRIVDEHRDPMSSAVVEPHRLYYIEKTVDKSIYVLYTEPTGEQYSRFVPYRIVADDCLVTVGRNEGNSIIYPSKFVSGVHAQIDLRCGMMSVTDLNSSNGTYVNRKSISRWDIGFGDKLYIMGLQIIFAKDFLFINNPEGIVRINTYALEPFHLPEPTVTDDGEDVFEDEAPEEFYYRAPRFKYDVDRFELKLDAPPTNQNDNEMPLIMMVGPSMTMGMASVATGVYSVTNAIASGNVVSAIPSLVMCVSMLLGTMMWPVVTRTYQRRMSRQKEAKRQKRYQEYLAQMEQKLADVISEQEKILWENDISMNVRSTQILSPHPVIWERTHKHTDFLALRLGSGNLPVFVDINYAKRQFSIDDDNLTEAMYRFGEMERLLHNVPICLPLAERFVSGVCADRETLLLYAQNMIMQIVSLHAYDEVRLVVLYNESDADSYSFVRWLPHTFDEERHMRFIATNYEEAKEVSNALDSVIESRKQMSEDALNDEQPYYVIVCLDKQLTEKAECVRRILEYKNNLRISVLCFYPKLEDLPKECSAVVEVGADDKAQLTLIDDISSPPLPFWKDETRHLDILSITRMLANTEINLTGFRFVLPKQYTLFEMLHIGMIEHLNLIERWKTSDVTSSLAAQVGIDSYGEPLRLDLHERAHGPHGLVAGTTGSGKSEFLIAYVLSMAIQFHPNDVAFILIDYKGGGMAKSFEGIPHTAGVITNLDGNGIVRSLVSMRSELHRRERIFAQTSQTHGISNIDIYKYQRLFHEGKVAEPLPHLIIISDEFAELKKEQPDFMTELTSTARVGRSLGVHLILATQKPTGVVDDQIRSNSNFKICLKVQDNGDSQDMLGRPDAAALVDAGRFYLQVGNNEIFELGQSVWAGAPYYPSPVEINNQDDGVSVINTNGRVIAEANTNRFSGYKNPPKQLDVVTKYISDVCEKEGIQSWKMWLDPIPPRIAIDDLKAEYGVSTGPSFLLDPIIGEYDDPAHQRQELMRVPLTTDGNVIVYGAAGSGKSMFLESLCYSLISDHSPREVNLYILDFDAELLAAFVGAPHVGDVILSHEAERIVNLFKLLIGQLEKRKKVLSEFGGGLLQYNQRAEDPLPNIVVIINNYAIFSELYEELTGDINYISREGTKYGVYLVLTCTGINQVRLNLRQNFKQLFCLQLNNIDDYSSVIGKTNNLYPEKYAGRGLFRYDKNTVLEFQTGLVTLDGSPYDFIREYCRKLCGRYSGQKAMKVPVLPDQVTSDFLSSYCVAGSMSRVPVGVEKESLNIAYFDFDDSVVSLVLSVNEEWSSFADALGALVFRHCGIRTIVFAPEKTAPAVPQSDAYRYCTDTQQCLSAVGELFKLVLTRNNSYKEALDAGRALPEFEPVLVIFESLSLLRNALERAKLPDGERFAEDDTPMNRIRLAMEKARKVYGIRFVVAESVNALNAFASDGWYKEHINGNRGIWLGNGIGNQFRLNVSRRPQGASDDMGEHFGFTIKQAVATLVKFLE